MAGKNAPDLMTMEWWQSPLFDIQQRTGTATSTVSTITNNQPPTNNVFPFAATQYNTGIQVQRNPSHGIPKSLFVNHPGAVYSRLAQQRRREGHWWCRSDNLQGMQGLKDRPRFCPIESQRFPATHGNAAFDIRGNAIVESSTVGNTPHIFKTESPQMMVNQEYSTATPSSAGYLSSTLMQPGKRLSTATQAILKSTEGYPSMVPPPENSVQLGPPQWKVQSLLPPQGKPPSLVSLPGSNPTVLAAQAIQRSSGISPTGRVSLEHPSTMELFQFSNKQGNSNKDNEQFLSDKEKKVRFTMIDLTTTKDNEDGNDRGKEDDKSFLGSEQTHLYRTENPDSSDTAFVSCPTSESFCGGLQKRDGTIARRYSNTAKPPNVCHWYEKYSVPTKSSVFKQPQTIKTIKTKKKILFSNALVVEPVLKKKENFNIMMIKNKADKLRIQMRNSAMLKENKRRVKSSKVKDTKTSTGTGSCGTRSNIGRCVVRPANRYPFKHKENEPESAKDENKLVFDSYQTQQKDVATSPDELDIYSIDVFNHLISDTELKSPMFASEQTVPENNETKDSPSLFTAEAKRLSDNYLDSEEGQIKRRKGRKFVSGEKKIPSEWIKKRKNKDGTTNALLQSASQFLGENFCAGKRNKRKVKAVASFEQAELPQESKTPTPKAIPVLEGGRGMELSVPNEEQCNTEIDDTESLIKKGCKQNLECSNSLTVSGDSKVSKKCEIKLLKLELADVGKTYEKKVLKRKHVLTEENNLPQPAAGETSKQQRKRKKQKQKSNGLDEDLSGKPSLKQGRKTCEDTLPLQTSFKTGFKQCRFCGKTTHENLMKHYAQYHRYRCFRCTKEFESKQDKIAHHEANHASDDLHCTPCAQHFLNSNVRNKHFASSCHKAAAAKLAHVETSSAVDSIQTSVDCDGPETKRSVPDGSLTPSERALGSHVEEEEEECLEGHLDTQNMLELAPVLEPQTASVTSMDRDEVTAQEYRKHPEPLPSMLNSQSECHRDPESVTGGVSPVRQDNQRVLQWTVDSVTGRDKFVISIENAEDEGDGQLHSGVNTHHNLPVDCNSALEKFENVISHVGSLLNKNKDGNKFDSSQLGAQEPSETDSTTSQLQSVPVSSDPEFVHVAKVTETDVWKERSTALSSSPCPKTETNSKNIIDVVQSNGHCCKTLDPTPVPVMSEQERQVPRCSCVSGGVSQDCVPGNNYNGGMCDTLTDNAITDIILDLEECYGRGSTDNLVLSKDEAVDMDETQICYNAIESILSYLKEGAGSPVACISSEPDTGPVAIAGSGLEGAPSVVTITHTDDDGKTALKEAADFVEWVMPCPVVKHIDDHTTVDKVGVTSDITTGMMVRNDSGGAGRGTVLSSIVPVTVPSHTSSDVLQSEAVMCAGTLQDMSTSSSDQMEEGENWDQSSHICYILNTFSLS